MVTPQSPPEIQSAEQIAPSFPPPAADPAQRVAALRQEVQDTPHPTAVRRRISDLEGQERRKLKDLRAAEKSLNKVGAASPDIQAIRQHKLNTIREELTAIQSDLQAQRELWPRAKDALTIRRELGMPAPPVSDIVPRRSRREVLREQVQGLRQARQEVAEGFRVAGREIAGAFASPPPPEGSTPVAPAVPPPVPKKQPAKKRTPAPPAARSWLDPAPPARRRAPAKKKKKPAAVARQEWVFVPPRPGTRGTGQWMLQTIPAPRPKPKRRKPRQVPTRWW